MDCDLDTSCAITSRICVRPDTYTTPTGKLLSQAKLMVFLGTLRVSKPRKKRYDTISDCLVTFLRRETCPQFYLPVEYLLNRTIIFNLLLKTSDAYFLVLKYAL